MTQGLFAGCTNYGSQTLSDIKIDVESWKKYTLNIKILFEENILQLSKGGYWNSKVPFNFRIFCEAVPKICDTFMSDFAIILKDIDNNNITKRTINLMCNIASIAHDNEEQSWRTYKEDSHWKEYGEANFKLAEELYSQGRDFFVSLFDVGNAAARMEDYITCENETTVVNNINNNIDNSIKIGNNNKIKSSHIDKSNTINKSQKENKALWKIVVPIIVSAIACVVGTAICVWLGLK